MTGRPTLRTPEVIDAILERTAAGDTLEDICRTEGMPKSRTVYDWLDGDADLAAVFARARKAGIDLTASNLRRVAKGEPGYSTGDVQRDKLIIDTDLKLLSKWDHGRYGDKLQVESKGTMAVAVTIQRLADAPAQDAQDGEGEPA